MEVTKEQLSKAYSQKTNEELLELKAGGTLTVLAQLVLDEELRTRNVSGSVVEEQMLRQAEEKTKIKAAISGLAPNQRRLAAYFVDFWIPPLVLVPVDIGAAMVFSESIADDIGVGSLLLWLAYILFKDGFDGQSIGKRLLKIRVVEDDSGLPCSMPKSLIRNLTLWFGIFDCLPMFGEKQKRIGDYFAGTSVVNL